jgi:hypothetical protein
MAVAILEFIFRSNTFEIRNLITEITGKNTANILEWIPNLKNAQWKPFSDALACRKTALFPISFPARPIEESSEHFGSEK